MIANIPVDEFEKVWVLQGLHALGRILGNRQRPCIACLGPIENENGDGS